MSLQSIQIIFPKEYFLFIIKFLSRGLAPSCNYDVPNSILVLIHKMLITKGKYSLFNIFRNHAKMLQYYKFAAF